MKKILITILVVIALLLGAGCDILQDELLSRLPADIPPPQPVRETLTLLVPEGFTLARIGMTLEEMGVCTVWEFIDAAQNGDFSEFPLVAAQTPNPHRCFALEGYLFPDTYQFYLSDTPEMLIRKMLANTERKITDALRIVINESGYTVDEILALASIIEKEAFGPPYMNKISSVLHNRLDIGMMLQCDVTIISRRYQLSFLCCKKCRYRRTLLYP
jgi:cell division protein YceG involved in septum cleavage